MIGLLFKYEEVNPHQLRIRDETLKHELDGTIETPEDGYLDEDIFPNNELGDLMLRAHYQHGHFKRSNTIQISTLFYVSTKGEEYIEHKVCEHGESVLDEIYFDLKKDGHYKIVTMVMPTDEWFATYYDINKDGDSNLDIYFYDKNLQAVKHYLGGNAWKESNNPILDIIALTLRNPNSYENTSISFYTNDIFYYQYLKDCYLANAKPIISKKVFDECSKVEIKDYIWKRDFVWMTINAIKFYIELGESDCSDNDLYYEAQRLIEILNGCNGICSTNSVKVNKYGCGCS